MNPEPTLNEHINSNVGVEMTYAAYQQFVDRSHAEPMLPGLDYTPNQLFWISAVRPSCVALQLEKYHIDYECDVPYPYSVNGPLSNSERFSRDFNCKVGSPMNPENKCKLW